MNFILDALPMSFWDKLSKETIRYAKQQRNKPTHNAGRGRAWTEYMARPANLFRMVAAVIMRGLCPSSTVQEFFGGLSYNVKGTSRRFTRTGASEFLGLPLVVYEQLVRYLHLSDNYKRPPVDHQDHDKCWHVRPIISLTQQAFRRWFSPGTHSALDEGGFPSRHRLMRHRNASKPNKYFIEVLMCCCSETRFCHTFFINEGNEQKVQRRERRVGQSKYEKIVYHQTEFTKKEIKVVEQFGTVAGAKKILLRSAIILLRSTIILLRSTWP